MTPALIYWSDGVLPLSKIEGIQSAIIWERNGHRRFIPQERIREFLTMAASIEKFAGPDTPRLTGILWSMTEEYKPYDQEYPT